MKYVARKIDPVNDSVEPVALQVCQPGVHDMDYAGITLVETVGEVGKLVAKSLELFPDRGVRPRLVNVRGVQQPMGEVTILPSLLNREEVVVIPPQIRQGFFEGHTLLLRLLLRVSLSARGSDEETEKSSCRYNGYHDLCGHKCSFHGQDTVSVFRRGVAV